MALRGVGWASLTCVERLMCLCGCVIFYFFSPPAWPIRIRSRTPWVPTAVVLALWGSLGRSRMDGPRAPVAMILLSPAMSLMMMNLIGEGRLWLPLQGLITLKYLSLLDAILKPLDGSNSGNGGVTLIHQLLDKRQQKPRNPRKLFNCIFSEFPPITTEQQRQDYKRQFDKDHQEYKNLQADMDNVNKNLAEVDQDLDNLEEGSPQFLVS